jgi:type II secretory pathway component GspD/PulD (secretin)
MRRAIVPTILVAVVTTPTTTSAQAPAGATTASVAAPPNASGRVQLPSEMELARLVDLAAARRGVRVEYDAGALKTSVTLRMLDGLDDSSVWQLAKETLQSRGFVLVQREGSGTYAVVRLADAAAQAPVLHEPLPAIGKLPEGFVTCVVRARHRSTKDLGEAIRPLLSKPGGVVAPVPGTDLLMISEFSDRFDALRPVLDVIDAASAGAVVREVLLRNTTSDTLVPLLAQVSAKKEIVTGQKPAGDVLPGSGARSVLVVAPLVEVDRWVALVEQLDAREATQTRAYTPRVFPAADVARLAEQITGVGSAGAGDERFRIVVDDLTGTLIVTGTSEQHERVSSLVERLDAVDGAAARPVRAFPIRNRGVGEIVATLRQLIAAGVLEPGGGDAATGAGQAQQTVGPSQAFNPTFSPQASGTPGVDAAAGRRTAPSAGSSGASSSSASAARAHPLLPGREDRRAGDSGGAGLTLTADEGTNTLIAVGEPRLLGQVESLLKLLDVRQPQVMLEVTLVSLSESDTLTLGVELEKLDTLGDASVRLSSLFGLSSAAAGGTRTVGDAAGFTGAVLSPGDYSVILKALANVSQGRTTTMPKVLVSNNESAQFSSVVQQPVTTTNIVSRDVTSTSFAGTQDAGTTISVRPQIAEGDHLVLTYSITQSAFVGQAAAAGIPPPRQNNSVSSSATIPDGHSVVVGGLEVLGESESVAKVPILGDIPLLGEVFKSRSTGVTKSKFYVFIRPVIMRHETFEDLKFASERPASEAGVSDGLPAWEARVMR